MKKERKPKASATAKPGRSKKIPCPTCGLLYKEGIGMASHIRSKHADSSQGQPGPGNQVITGDGGPQLHLQSALDQLVAKKKQLDQEIEAVHIAMRAFGQQKSMAASA